MSLLASDPQVVLDREFPYESRYLTLFVKFSVLLQHPNFFCFFNEEQLFDPNYLGFGGYRPGTEDVSPERRASYLPRENAGSWARAMWEKFNADIAQRQPQARFYAEKAPLWLAPHVRQLFPCLTLYNVRDPRDIFISANAFMKKRQTLSFARAAGDTDRDHARRLALAFANCFANYDADRSRSDVLLVTYEELVQARAAVVERIRVLTGLSLTAALREVDSPEVEAHATAPDRQASVARWRSEPISEDVVRFLEQTLNEEMTALGYPLSLSTRDSAFPRIGFGRENQGILGPFGNLSRYGYLESKPEHAIAHVRGHDFHINVPLQPFSAHEVKEIWACVQGDIGNHCSLYWRQRDTRFSEQACIHVPHAPSPVWLIVPFRVAQHPEWKGEITKLRLDLFNNCTQPHRGIGRIRWVQLVS